MKRMNLLMILALAFTLLSLKAQNIPLTEANWKADARGVVFERFEGAQSMYIYQGSASLKNGVDFKTGVIEFDVYVTERRGFPGVRFRKVDQGNWEEFYIRPHQSGNPDANQYTPVYNGIAGWQAYYGSPNAVAYSYQMNKWNHIKLKIAEDAMEVYINDMEEPLLFIPDLEREPASGKIELYAGGPSGFRFANFKVLATQDVDLKNDIPEPKVSDEKVIRAWQVSESFDLEQYFSKNKFDFKKAEKLDWKNLKVTNRGHVNMSQWALLNDKNNTSIAKVTIESDTDQIKKLSYGFSDEVIVFLNGKIIHGGTDTFRSRDYRYLGTVGYFDHLYLDLEKGKNELWMVVTELMGGWVVQGKFEDLEGIRIVD